MISHFATLALSVLLATSASASTPFSGKPLQSKNDAKSTFVSKVMSGARPTKNSRLARRLDGDEEEEIDLTPYYVKYMKCQFVKTYSDEQAEEADTVLATKRFVIFRLCPSSSCSYNYGEYMVDMDIYLESALEYFQEQQEGMCDACEEVCQQDDDGGRRRKLARKLLDASDIDCDSCVDECEKIENMEDNGYIDASNYMECQEVGEDDDGDGVQYYAGAMCASSGEKIKIGVFTDEDCTQYDSSLSVENYIEYKLSHALLKQVYSSSNLVPCVKVDWEIDEEDEYNENGDEDEEEEEVEANEMCQELYEQAAKCESKHGFADSYANYDQYSNQASQEDLVCEFINTISNGAYSSDGEIVLQSKASTVEGGTMATGGQKFALTVFVLGTVGLAVFAASLHSQLTKGGTANLSTQGGAMA